MLRELGMAYFDGLVSDTDYELACAAQRSSSWKVTNGLELEVRSCALADTLEPTEVTKFARKVESERRTPMSSENPLHYMGVAIDADAVYELVTPHSQHPFAQYIMMKALANKGVLPDATSGVIPAHVNLGLYNKSGDYEDNLIYALRALELCDGSSWQRLEEPFTETEECSWDFIGELGVSDAISGISRWTSSTKKRIEFRTLQYKSLEQMAKINEMAFYLGQAATGERGVRAKIWRNFRANFTKMHSLPDHVEYFSRDNSEAKLESYFRSYIELMKHGVCDDVHELTLQTCFDVRQSLGHTAIPSSLIK